MATITGGEAMAAHMAAMREKITNASEVRVGFLEGATYPDGTPVAEVAAINNFGAPLAGIPARPFFSGMVREKSPEWGDKFAAVLKAANYDAEKALALMGEGIAGQLRQAIVETSGPPNSPVTDLLKQRFPMRDGMTFADVQQAREDIYGDVVEYAPPGKPLSWTGHMLNSVDKEVE